MTGSFLFTRLFIKHLFTRGPSLGLRLMVFIVLSIVLMCLDHKNQYVGSVRSILSVVVMPLQYAGMGADV